MQHFQNKVAVITGAASGIGLALAQRCAHEGMRVVMADLDASALDAAVETVRAEGAEVLAVPTDVACEQAMQALADAAVAKFGTVHVLFNNAGVGIVTPILSGTVADWEWALGVNLWSVIHGVRLFVPIMRTQQSECHIVNTASIAGLISPPGLGIYRTTKHAMVAFSEALAHELAEQAPHISVSVLCPGMVRTHIMQSAYRIGTLSSAAGRDDNEEQRLQRAMSEAMPPDEVAERTFVAMRAKQFYILTHQERNVQIKQRMERILSEQ